MAVTSTQSVERAGNFAAGRYITTGAAAAIAITTGFLPRYVKVVNVDSGDMVEWYEGMAAASACKTVGATGARSLITTLGITVNSRGFTIGVDLDVNVSTEQLSWTAHG